MAQEANAKRAPFQHRAKRDAADRAIVLRIEQQTRRLQREIIPEQNRQGLKHGRHWQTRFADQPDRIQEVKEHATEMALPLKSIIEHDLSVLDEFLVELPKRMHGQFMQSMYQLLHETTAATGNVVSKKPFPEAFAEMLERISFGVDRWGIPSLPTLHVPPAMQAEIERFIAQPDPAYSEYIKELTEARKKEAIAREAKRISRFKLR